MIPTATTHRSCATAEWNSRTRLSAASRPREVRQEDAALCSRGVYASVQRKWRWAISMNADNVSWQSSAFVITATAVPDAGHANEKQL